MGFDEALTFVPLAGAVLFVVVLLLDGATRPRYDPRRHPVSALALGSRGWLQTANFFVLGAAFMTGAVVTVRRGVVEGSFAEGLWGGGLAVLAAGVVASGLFRMDPLRGYPPGTAESDPASVSRTHQWHDLAGSVVFMGMPVLLAGAALVPGLVVPLRVAWVLAGLLTGWLVVRFEERWEAESRNAGLWQRAALIVGLPGMGVITLVM